ncbi:flagellar hook-length control protein FliK [Aidingimonas lacisalsi]|uniref:flagellar hook-length control protein FliK n=1 Tax=Aidingimonas lacisalsi TaxID=2604086 RepID=UPI0011D21E75|nr:flagellar hook-length control protein FliK [Aidingimonas lacisalsi]
MDITTLLAATGKSSTPASGQPRDAGGDMSSFAQQLEQVAREHQGTSTADSGKLPSNLMQQDQEDTLSLRQIMERLGNPETLSEDMLGTLADELGAVLDRQGLDSQALVEGLTADGLLDEDSALGQALTADGIDLDTLSSEEALAAIQEQLTQLDDTSELAQITASFIDNGVLQRGGQTFSDTMTSTVRNASGMAASDTPGTAVGNTASSGNPNNTGSSESLISRHVLAQAAWNTQQPGATPANPMMQAVQGDAEGAWKEFNFQDNLMQQRADGSARHADPSPSLASLNGNTQPVTAAATSATPTATLTQPVASQAWQQQLGQQLVNLSRSGEQQIDLKLNPPELGPLSVSLKVGDQGAQAQFLSSQVQVRQAIEQAIPQLREALEEQGISLGEAMVGDHPQGQQQQAGLANDQSGRRYPGSASGLDGSVALEDQPADVLSADSLSSALNGRVDLYA